jgi:hypothetical protein
LNWPAPKISEAFSRVSGLRERCGNEDSSGNLLNATCLALVTAAPSEACTRGAVYDVVVDLRPDSPTFHRWAGFELKASVDTLIYVPTGCAHGIQTLEDDTEIMYAVSAFHAPEAERGLRWDDPFFNITWPVAAPIVSAKDAQWPNYQHSVAATGCAGS